MFNAFTDISAWSSHYKWLDCLRVNVASLLLAGLACAIIPLVGRSSYNLLVAAGSLFGLFSGALLQWIPLIRIESSKAELVVVCVAFSCGGVTEEHSRGGAVRIG